MKKYDTDKYKVITPKSGMMIHWVLNPGLIINELLLGQRFPKIQLKDKDSSMPRFERYHVPCPHCDTIHDGRTWSPQNGTIFRNWFGLYCSNCGKVIPCVMNYFSFIILAITSPFWWFFKEKMKENWLQKQPERYKNIDIEAVKNPFDEKSWIYSGLSYGIIMFLVMSILFPLAMKDPITTKSLILGAIIWILGSGLIYGYLMKLFFGVGGDKKNKLESKIE